MENSKEEFAEIIIESIKEMKDRWGKVDRKLINDLADMGWFLNGSHTDKFSYTAIYLLSENEYDRVDSWFEEYYSSQAAEIFQLLVKKYPEIKKMLSDAEKCHFQEMYFASIPLFFIIAEFIANKGINEIIGSEQTNFIFNKSRRGLKKKPGTLVVSHYLRGVIERYSFNNPFATNAPIYSEHTINIDTKSLQNNSPFELNRHSVLHGMNNIYGNKLNSLKALCYLDFLDIELRSLKFKIQSETKE